MLGRYAMNRPVTALLALATLIGAGVGCGGLERAATSGTTGPTTGGGGYNYSMTQPVPQAGGVQVMTADLDIRLTVDGDQVTGTVEGPSRQTLTQPSCPSETVADGKTTATVTGVLTPETLKLRVIRATWTPPQVQPCPGGGTPGLMGQGMASGIYDFEKSLSLLERADDGAYRYDHVETVDVHGFTVDYHVVVRFARQ